MVLFDVWKAKKFYDSAHGGGTFLTEDFEFTMPASEKTTIHISYEGYPVADASLVLDGETLFSQHFTPNPQRFSKAFDVDLASGVHSGSVPLRMLGYKDHPYPSGYVDLWVEYLPLEEVVPVEAAVVGGIFGVFAIASALLYAHIVGWV